MQKKLKIIKVPMRGTKTITILVMVGTGSKYENKKNNGISHFLEHMFFKGTKKRPNTMAISSELDALGAEFNAFTGKEYTGYWVKVEAGKIKKAIDILADMFLNSLFEQKEIDREKGVIIEELNMYEDNPMMHIEDVFEQVLYGDTPAGWDTIGTKENILSFKQKDFLNYFNSQYNPDSTVICLAGNFSGIGDIKKEVERKFLKKSFLQKNSFKEKEKVVDEQKSPQVKIKHKKTDQAHLSLGVRTFPKGDKREIVLKLLSIILGGSMSSRLFISLREREGLAYYTHTSAEFYSDSGYLTTQSGVPVDKVERAIKIILKEYKKLSKNLIEPKELKRVKDMLIGRMAIQLEASDNVANWYARQEVMARTIKRERGESLKIVSPQEYLEKIKSIKAIDIKKVSQEIFVEKNLNLAVIGDYKDEKRFLELLRF